MTIKYTFVLVATNRQADDSVDTDATKQAIILQDEDRITGYIDGDKAWPEEETHDEVMNRNVDRFRRNADLVWGTDWYGFKVLSDIFPELEIHR